MVKGKTKRGLGPIVSVELFTIFQCKRVSGDEVSNPPVQTASLYRRFLRALCIGIPFNHELMLSFLPDLDHNLWPRVGRWTWGPQGKYQQILLIFSFSYWECPLAVRGVLSVWICQLAGLCSTLSVSTRLFTGICLWLLYQQRSFLHHSFFGCLGCFLEHVSSISLQGGELVCPSILREESSLGRLRMPSALAYERCCLPAGWDAQKHPNSVPGVWLPHNLSSSPGRSQGLFYRPERPKPARGCMREDESGIKDH